MREKKYPGDGGNPQYQIAKQAKYRYNIFVAL